MITPAPLIQRLQSHQAKARRMLTPGLKDSAGQQRSFSPVLDGLGSQRYSQIIQNMRFLGQQRLGSLKPESINLIGRELPAKFANIADLLRIKTPSAADSSIWAQVDQTLPASNPTAQTPDEPGIMRQGTVISRLPTVPKAGQDLEAFKQQVQSRASSAKPAAPVRKPPRPGDPSVRRFARIEEISNKETPAASEPPAVIPPAVPPATVQRQPEPMSDVLKADARNRPAPVLEPAKTPEARTSERPAPVVEPPKPPAPRTPEQPAPVSEPRKPPAPRTPERPVPVSKPSKALEAHTPVHPAQAAPISTPVARPDAPLLRAVPTPKKQNQAPALALPKARPTATPQAGKLIQTPMPRAHIDQSKISAPAPSAVIQRQADKKLSAAEIKPSQPNTPESPGVPSVEFGETRQEAPIAFHPDASDKSVPAELPDQDSPAPVAQPAPHPPEAPLLTQLSRRRSVSEQVRFLEPKIVKPETTRPALIRSDLRQPKRQTRASSPQASEPVQPTVFARPRQPATQLPARSSEQPAPQTDLAQAPVEMPVARQTESAAPLPVKSPVVEQAVVSHQLPKNKVQPEARPVPTVAAASSNVVQRLWEEHSDSGSGSGGGSSAPEQGGSGGGDALDLDKIAAEVFPIVKRLMEIESERSSGYLR